MIDTHCHLADRKFREDLREVLERASAVGISEMITISDSIEESEECLQLGEIHEHIFCTVGVHPHEAKRWRQGDDARLHALATRSPKVRAIGEIGLDYHYDLSPRDVQRRVLEEQLILARELSLPAVVHCREAIRDLRTLIEQTKPDRLVLHCCTERWTDVEPLIDAGYFLSFTGIATYPSAGDIRETIRHCPLERLMLETDAPYLAPVPHRGERNEPAFLHFVAAAIAEVKGITLEEVDRATTANALAFFSLPTTAP